MADLTVLSTTKMFYVVQQLGYLIQHYFTTLPLGQFLLLWNLTTFGTLQKDKKYIPAETRPPKHVKSIQYYLKFKKML